MSHNQKLILGLIWRLILRYQLGVRDQSKGKSDGGSPKKTLLAWVQAVIPHAGVTNFTTNWNNGQTISALVDRMKPGLIPDHQYLEPDQALENTCRAMSLAEEYFDIPQVLHPEDLCTMNPDELSVITYVSYFCSQDSPGQHILMDWIHRHIPQPAMSNFTTDWMDGISLGHLADAISGGGFPDYRDMDPQDSLQNVQKAMEFAEVNLGVPKVITAEQVVNPKLDPIQMMTYLTYYEYAVPSQKPPPALITATGLGISPDGGFLGEQATFVIHGEFPDSAELEVTVTGPGGEDLEVLQQPSLGDKVICSYIPMKFGLHTVAVQVDGHHIPESPFTSGPRDPSNSSKCLVSQPENPVVGVNAEILVDCSSGGPGQVHAEVKGPSGSVQTEITENGQQCYAVTFTPIEAGMHMMSIQWAGKDVSGSPLSCQVSDPKKCIPSGHGLTEAIISDVASFDVQVKNAGPGPLEVKVSGPSDSVPVTVKEENGTYVCSYTPTEKGQLQVEVKWAGVPITGSPFQVMTADDSKCHIEDLPTGFLRVGKDYSFILVTSDAGDGIPEASGQGASMPFKCEVRPKDLGSYVVAFNPSEVGNVSIHLTLNGATFPGSPLGFKVNDPTKCFIISASMQSRYTESQPVDLMVSVQAAGEGELKAKLYAPGQEEKEIEVKALGDSTQLFLVQFTPVEIGQHSIDITFDGHQIQNAPACFFVGREDSGGDDVIVIQPTPGKLGAFIVDNEYLYNVDAVGANERELSVSACGIGSGSKPEVVVIDQGNQQFIIGIKATVPDDYAISIKLGEDEVPASPFNITFEAEPDASHVHVSGPHSTTAAEPVSLICNTSDAGAGTLSATCHGKKAGLVPVELQQKEKHLFHVVFDPPQEDEYTITVLFNKESVPGSPFTIGLIPTDPSKIVVTEPKNIGVSCCSVFTVDVEDAGPGKLSAFCQGSNSAKISIGIGQKDDNPDHFEVEVTPLMQDKYSLHILWDSKEVSGSPFEIDLLPCIFPDRVRVTIPLELSHANPYCIVDCTSAGPGKVTASCSSDRHGTIDKVEVEDTEKEGIYKVTFAARGTDNYHISILFNGQSVPGSPFAIPLLSSKERADASKCVVENVPSGRLRLGKTYNFVVITEEAGDGRLEAVGCGTSLPVKYAGSPTDSRSWTIAYSSYEVGFQALAITFNGSPIPASPLKFHVIDPTKCHFNASALAKGHYKTKKQVNFLISAQSAGRAELNAQISSPLGDEDVSVIEKGNSIYLVQFTPLYEGEHSISITFDGDQVPDSPAPFFVNNQGSAAGEVVVIEPSPTENGIFLVENPIVYTLDATGANEAMLTASGCGIGSGSQPLLTVTDHGEQLFSLAVEANVPDNYSISIRWGEDEVPGSPFNIAFAARPDASRVRLNGPHSTVATEPVSLKCNTNDAGTGVLTATCCGKRVGVVPVNIEARQSHHFSVIFNPLLEDVYTLNVFFAGDHTPGSPFKINLVPSDASKVSVSKPSKIGLSCQSVFTVDATEAGAGDLSAVCPGENSESLPVSIVKKDDDVDHYDVKITPLVEDHFHLFIFWNDVEVPGCPFEVNLLPQIFPDRVQVKVPEGNSDTNPYCLVDTANAGPGRVTAICTSKKYGTVDSVAISCTDSSTEHQVSFTPLGADDYHMSILYGYKPVPGSPFLLSVRPAVQVCEGTEPDASKVTVDGPHSKPMVFVSLDTSKAGDGKVIAECHGTSSNSVPVEIEQKKEGNCNAVFFPTSKDVYTLSIYYAQEHIRGSPFTVNLLPTKFTIDSQGFLASLDSPTAIVPELKKNRSMSVYGQFAPDVAVGPGVQGLLSKTLPFGEPCQFNISTKGAGPGSLNVMSRGVGKAEVLTSQVDDNTYMCTVVPAVPGKYQVDILWNNKHIPGSPCKLRFHEKAKRSIIGFNVGREDMKLGVPVSFRLYTTDLGTGSLEIKCLPESGADIKVERVLDDKYAVQITPKEIGTYTIMIMFNGRNLAGSPMNVVFKE